MSDEVTLGEVRRGLQEHRQSSAEQHRALDERITGLANHSVSDAVYQLDKAATVEMARRLERDRVEDVRKLREDVIKPMLDRLEKVEGRPAMSLARWLGVVTVGLGLVALLIQAYGTLRGAK